MIIFFASTQFLVVLLLAPGVLGLIRKFKAIYQNRIGAPVYLPYVGLLSLLRKHMTITRFSSWVFRAVPFVVLGTSLALALLSPSLMVGIVAPSVDNFFLLGAILMLGSIFLVFGGMDTASTFGGMGSSREMTLASLLEPSLFVIAAALGVMAHTFSASGIVAQFVATPSLVWVALPTLAALLLVILAENARYPVDNPSTHLELTMVHEAMILEYSGPYLALLEYASMIKLTVMLLLLMNLALPFGLLSAPITIAGLALALLSTVLKLVIGAFLIASIESFVVKMRFFRMHEYMSLAFLTAIFGLAVALLV